MIMTFYFYVVEGVDRWNVDFLKMYKMEWWNFQDYALVLWPGLVPFFATCSYWLACQANNRELFYNS